MLRTTVLSLVAATRHGVSKVSHAALFFSSVRSRAPMTNHVMVSVCSSVWKRGWFPPPACAETAYPSTYLRQFDSRARTSRPMTCEADLNLTLTASTQACSMAGTKRPQPRIDVERMCSMLTTSTRHWRGGPLVLRCTTQSIRRGPSSIVRRSCQTGLPAAYHAQMAALPRWPPRSGRGNTTALRRGTR